MIDILFFIASISKYSNSVHQPSETLWLITIQREQQAPHRAHNNSADPFILIF